MVRQYRKRVANVARLSRLPRKSDGEADADEAASDSLATNRSAARLRGKRSDRRFTRSMAAGPHLGMGRKCLRLRVPIALLRADSGAEKILEVNGIR